MRIDARIPVRFGPLGSQRANEALFAPGIGVHVVGCACCVARAPAGVGLATLFQARATGTVQWFGAVLAAPEQEPAVRAALVDDPVASMRFRLADEP